MKAKPQGVVIKDVTDPGTQESKNRKFVGVLKRIHKVSALNNKEPCIQSTSPSRMLEPDRDSEETEDATFGNDDQTFCVSPREDTYIEFNTEEIHIHDLTINTSDVDINVASSEPLITSIPEQTIVTPPEVPISESHVDQGMTSNITENVCNMK